MVNYQEVEEQFIAKNLRQLPHLASRIIEAAGDHAIWLFQGEMGAGKTTLIQAVCAEKGVIDDVTSPTYSIINEYITSENQLLYHFDFFRLNDAMEALDIGCDEYFHSGNICFIEWPGRVSSILPNRNITISIEVNQQDHRLITVKKNDSV